MVRFDSDDVVVEPPDPAAWVQRPIDEEKVRQESETRAKRRGGARRPPLMRRLGSPYGGYWPSSRDRRCVGGRLPFDPVGGIDESTFTGVMESLYDDSVRLIDESI